MKKYTNLIQQNIAPKEAKKIAVFNSAGNKIGIINLGNLAQTLLDKKLYSFGALSDVHITYETAESDFQKALTYLNKIEKVDFICICGDLISQGLAEQLNNYKTLVDTYSNNTPVYAISGNHESYDDNWGQNSEDVIKNLIETYTGKPLYYSFEYNNDVFIMVGIKSDSEGKLFSEGELQWLYETLEANRNKRCFVFEHVRPQDGCGNAYGIYSNDIWGGTEATIFESLMKHYKNAILFHGHSHLKLALQTKDNLANIDRLFGSWSVHIPSLSVPRTGDISGAPSKKELYAESEGYIVDVYENCIILRGRDFIKNEYIPLGIYCLDTTLTNIEANTFVDSSNTLNTQTKEK